MMQKIPVDGNLKTLDGEGFGVEPFGIDIVRRLSRRAFA
jgi:hypothetical protein